jgi:hypothetical protein
LPEFVAHFFCLNLVLSCLQQITVPAVTKTLLPDQSPLLPTAPEPLGKTILTRNIPPPTKQNLRYDRYPITFTVDDPCKKNIDVFLHH